MCHFAVLELYWKIFPRAGEGGLLVDAIPGDKWKKRLVRKKER
jgi:hypothetical protein